MYPGKETIRLKVATWHVFLRNLQIIDMTQTNKKIYPFLNHKLVNRLGELMLKERVLLLI